MNLLLWRGIANGISWLGLGKRDTNSRARSKKQQERKKKSSEEDAKSLFTMKEAVKTAKSVIVVFGVLCCIELLKWRDRHENCEPWASQGLCEKNSDHLEYMMSNCRSSCAKAGILKFHWTYNLRFLLFLSIAILLLTRVVATSVAASLVEWNKACLLHEEFEKLLTLPFDLCQEVHLLGARWSVWQANVDEDIKLQPTIIQSKVEIVLFGSLSLVVMFGIIFGVNDHSEFVAYIFFLGAIILLLWILFDLYQTMKMKQTIYVKSSKAKELEAQQNKKLQEILNKSSIDVQVKLQIQPAVAGDSYRTMHMSGSRRSVWKAIELIQEAVGTEHVSTTKPSNTVPVQESAVSSTVNASVSEPQPIQEELPTTPESPVQHETSKDNNRKNLAEEISTADRPTATAVSKEEEVPSEIGIDTSQQGMTRETITEASYLKPQRQK